MPKRSALWLCVLFALSAGVRPALGGEKADPPPAEPAEEERLPGVALAQTVATATGLAITPLLGVSAVGAWSYYKTPEAERAALPWYAAPWFWATGLTLVFLLLAKDLVLGVVPGAKKPLDALEVLENKASALLLAAPAIVPMFAATFPGDARQTSSQPPQGMALAGVAPVERLSELPATVAWSLGLVIVLVLFFVIWLAFHAINVLILISPFGPLDLLLRGVKLFFLVGLVGATWINPYLGLGVSLLILLLAVPIAGWSFRLMVFGWAFAWDLVTLRHRRYRKKSGRATAFTTTKVGSAPVRTLGHLERRGGELCFCYRPWLALPERTLRLEQARYTVGRGVLNPVLLAAHEEREEGTPILRLPPRYRSHEADVSSDLGLAGVVDQPLLEGLRAAFAWLKEMVGRARSAGADWADQAASYFTDAESPGSRAAP